MVYLSLSSSLLMIISFIFIIIVIYIYSNNIISSNDKYENSNSNDHIYFMNSQDTITFLSNDNDRYVRNMSELDLSARNVKSHIEYINNIKETAIYFEPAEKELIAKCAANADKYFKSLSYKDFKYSNYINGTNIADIKWKFANTYTNRSNNKIKENEEGLPHTREKIIFLSKNVLKYDELNLTNTLIHEKIHIYQRYNQDVLDKIISDMELKELDRKSYAHAKYIRTNPDTNNKIYYNVNNKDIIFVCLYRNNNPNSINDVLHNNYSTEHPYEKIAYEIAGNFYKNNENKYINI